VLGAPRPIRPVPKPTSKRKTRRPT
jgi:hypothetical protein